MANLALAQIALRIQAVSLQNAWERTLSVGTIVLDGLCGGDVREWRAKRSAKAQSLRKLAAHPSCPLGKSALSSAVNVLIFVREYPSVRGLPHIAPGHVACVCNVSAQHALPLLREASGADWSVQVLRKHVQLLRRHAGDRRGRPLSPSVQRAETYVRHARNLLERIHQLLVVSERLDEATRSRLQRDLRALSEQCALLGTLGPLSQPLLSTAGEGARIERHPPLATLRLLNATP